MSYPFTACLAHVEVTVVWVIDGRIVKLCGIFEHNSGCEEARMNRLPAIPLHEHVYEVALEQLENGASLTAVQEKNQQMISARKYRNMDSYNTEKANFQYNFLSSDNATLYNKFSQKLGINTRKEPQTSSLKAEVHAAIFYYQARVEKNECLKVCITTNDMDQAAFKYIHHSQLIVDGTFGHLFAMGVDEENKGIPIALFLFSAPTGNHATHAGYNTEILAELFFAWNDHLSTKFNTSFEPYSALTDTDTKEHGALLMVWHSIILLICKFHLRQCWTNNRKKLRLVATTKYTAAMSLIQAEQSFYLSLVEKEDTRSIAEATLKHLSWSNWGRHAAAARIGMSIQAMIPTTNHLESFNCILKCKYIGS
ncbi:hypothetical protein F5878DRAFT_654682 [Lentinula raphanica]|uniref:MULE transposase domain-containing protein n=1 Tax=Lentinula raphanica TaxID=153919 RepID=A0AA38NX88_9AGAR|nr:hypothetical protein F5878DRAFT_654682 [Lentinula raphanica]